MPVKNGSETAGDGHSVESSQKSPTFVFDSIDAVDGVTEGSPPKPDSSAHGHFFRVSIIHGHRTLKAPHPVRSAQLTRVPPS